VIRPLQREKPDSTLTAVARSLHRHLDRYLDRCRPVIGVKDPLKSMRHNRAQALSEEDRWLVGNTGEDDVIQLLKLLRRGANERRMRMPVKATPPRRDPIKDLSTILKC
jgi:hypothetical protein